MFPSAASFTDFRENDREISEQAISAIIRYAFLQGVIDVENEKAFTDFLRTSSQKVFGRRLPDNFTFSDVLAAINGNSSVNTLIAQLDKTAQSLGMPSVSAPMVTRMKQNFAVNTAKKRVFLRLLAFWIAENRPELGWHYDTLLQIPAKTTGKISQPREKAGAAMSFHLRGQGEIVSPEDIAWLKNELADCLDYLKLSGKIHKKMIEVTGMTSFSILFPKQPGAPNEPMLYYQAIRNALAVAHQMSVRWLLCSQSSPRKRLLIMITAGLMQEDRGFDVHLPANVPANDTGIYLSDFAHLCAEISRIKGFRRCTAPNPHRSAPQVSMWSLIYFWPNYFYDYIPCLLEDRMLPKFNTGPEYEAFQHALFFPESNSDISFGALEAMHRHPQHALHLIEISKVLHARQMLHESEEFISRVLLTEPENLAARYIRMLAYGHLANREPGIHSSLTTFERGIEEGEFIIKNFAPDTEILWAMGILHFNRAVKLLQHLRRRHNAAAETVSTEDILAYLKKSADYFRKGLATSSAGQTDSCLFWLHYTMSFIELFSSNENNFFNRRITPEDDRNIFRQAGTRTLRNLGLLKNHTPPDSGEQAQKEDAGLKAALFIFSKNQNAMLGRSYIPYAQYTLAMVLWDFAPELTIPVCKIVHHLLEQARESAAKLLQDNLCVYHIFSGFMPADRYIQHVEQFIDLLQSLIPDDVLQQGNDHTISADTAQKMSITKLMLQEVDRL